MTRWDLGLWDALGPSGWFNAPAYADLAVVIDFNNWRAAITTVPPASIPTATPEQLCVKRAATVEEAFAFTCSSTSARTYTDATGTLRADLTVDQLRKDRINGRLQLALNGPSTNYISNNTMAGAVVGAPGILPTGWYNGGGSGITTAVVGFGTEDGIPYIDIAVTGTATATTSGFVITYFAGSNTIAAADGQTWTQSAFMRVVSGTVPAGLGVITVNRDSSGAVLTTISRVNMSPAASLGASRVANTTTINNASTAYVQQRSVFDLANGTTYNFVVRKGGIQLEQQPFATPLIFTSGTAVTRAIESARLSPVLEAVLQRSAASIVVRGQNLLRTNPAAVIGAPGSTRLIRVGGSTYQTFVTEGSNGILSSPAGADLRYNRYAVGLGFDGAGRALVRDGVAIASDANPVLTDRSALYLGRDGSGAASAIADGWYDFVGIAPSRLSNARLTELAVPVA